MNIKLPVLEKNDSWGKHLEKVEEESLELYEAIERVIYIGEEEIDESVLLHIAEEAFDNIEVCIGILDKLEQEHKGIIEKANLLHIKKLAERGWQFKSVLELKED